MTIARESVDGMPAESVPVTLARMEGNINLILFQVTQVASRVDHVEVVLESHANRLGTLEKGQQGLSDGMIARDRTAIEKAQALKDAKDAQEATARAESAKSDQTWSPFAKMFAVAAFIGVLVSIWVSVGV